MLEEGSSINLFITIYQWKEDSTILLFLARVPSKGSKILAHKQSFVISQRKKKCTASLSYPINN